LNTREAENTSVAQWQELRVFGAPGESLSIPRNWEMGVSEWGFSLVVGASDTARSLYT